MEVRISAPEEYEKYIDRLTAEDQGQHYKLFGTKQKVLMFAAAVGWKNKRRLPVGKKGAAVRPEIFEKACDLDFIRCLAVAETGSLQVLSNDEEQVRIFEEYSHGGLVEIAEKCFHAHGIPLEYLVETVQNGYHQPDPDLPGIDPAALRGLI